MNAQLQEIRDELRSARDRLHRLAGSLSDDAWSRRPGPDRWSPAECVAHLDLTSAAFVPLLREGLDRARALGGPPPSRYRRDPVGWLLWRTMGPPVRGRVKTIAPFVPRGDLPPEALIAEFDRHQEELGSIVVSADGLPLGRVRIPSPFAERVRYNLFSALSILPRHQHRHLWQAERAG